MVHIIKIYFENPKKEQEIRRLAVTSEVVSNFQYLLERIRNVFQLETIENLQVKWKDPENDFILMSSNDELAQALANAEEGLLRLYVSWKGERSESPPNIPSPPNSKASGDIHPFVVCDGCDGKIAGIRYKCLQCRNYDLCAVCEAADTHPAHDMIKFVKPTYVPREWVFLGARKMWRSMFNTHTSNVHFPPEFNTMPKSAPSCSTDNAPNASTEQPKKKCSNGNDTQESPTADFAYIPHMFMNQIQRDFGCDASTLPRGLGHVLRAVKGAINSVDCLLSNPEFGRHQGRNETTSPTTGAPTETTSSAAGTSTQTTSSAAGTSTQTAPMPSTAETPMQTSKSPIVENPSVTVANQAPEVIFVPSPTANEVSPIVDLNADTNKPTQSCAAANDNVDEIIIDTDAERPNTTEVAAATADGWTLLEGGDPSHMECGDGVVSNAPERPVVYPDLMEFEPNQESNKDHIETTDPVIIGALVTMRAMGFTNEGGWLERLLISKQGNINEALEALYPSIHHQ